MQIFLQNGTFKKGYNHFIQFGAKEGRFGTSFFESEYLSNNPDLVPLVNSGALKTGREHYFNFGQFEPSRFATFFGTSGNDILTGLGAGDVRLIGVKFGVIPGSFGQYQREESDGSSEFDTLIGGSGRDTLALSLSLLGAKASFVGLQQL